MVAQLIEILNIPDHVQGLKIHTQATNPDLGVAIERATHEAEAGVGHVVVAIRGQGHAAPNAGPSILAVAAIHRVAAEAEVSEHGADHLSRADEDMSDQETIPKPADVLVCLV